MQSQCNKDSKIDLLLIIGFGILIKFIVFCFALNWLGGDEFYYVTRGSFLAQGLIPYIDFPYAYTPGLLIFLSLPHLFFEQGYLALRIMTFSLDLGVIVFTYLISKKIFSRQTAIISSLLYLLNPLSLQTSATTMSEPYILFFLLGGVFFLLEKKYLTSALFFVFSSWIKIWITAFWFPLIAYFLFKKKVGMKYLIYLSVFFIVFFVPLLIISDALRLNFAYYSKVHDVSILSINLVFKNLLLVFTYGMVYLPYVPILFYNPWNKVKNRINVVMIYFFTNLCFLIFTEFYPSHHLLITLPAGCMLISNEIWKILEKFKIKIMALYVITLILCIPPIMISASSFNTWGLIPFKKENVMKVVNFIDENLTSEEYLLEDYAFYGYLSKRREVTRFGFHYGYFFTDEEMINILETTKPSLIVRTVERGYPEKFNTYLDNNFQKTQFTEDEMYVTYKTNYPIEYSYYPILEKTFI